MPPPNTNPTPQALPLISGSDGPQTQLWLNVGHHVSRRPDPAWLPACDEHPGPVPGDE